MAATGMARGNQTYVGVLVLSLLLVAPLIVYPVFLMKTLCYALFACAFNLLMGQVGLLSIGHAMFFVVPAYESATAARLWGMLPELAHHFVHSGLLTIVLRV